MLLADKLSCIRILFAPVFFVLYYIAWQWTKASHFIFSGLAILLIFVELTDYFDGYYARKLNQVSDVGKLLDPFADTILHISTFFCFTLTKSMPAYFFILIVYREFGMLFLRLLSLKQGIAVAARMGGKFKTVLYIIAGFYALALDIYQSLPFDFLPVKPFRIAQTLIFFLCAAAAYISFADYLIQFRKLKKKG
jgi:CDP-diacylglycerol--glycerol-3-phosphate 3-phosphatidyltransferase